MQPEDRHEVIRGELAIGRRSRATALYSVDPFMDRTMMQSCASSAKLRGGGPILHSGLKAVVLRRVTATSDRHRQTLAWGRQSAVLLLSSLSVAVCDHAGRNTMPFGTSPVVTRRQSAMSSLRANATIIVLRVPARPSAVRA